MPREPETSAPEQSLPAQVRTRLPAAPPADLVDPAALAAVRRRFDDTQAQALGRYLTAAQSPNTLRAYRTDWTAFAAWCLAQGRTSLPADPVDVAVYLASCAERTTPQGGWAASAATLQRRAAAIAAVHAAHGLHAPTRDDVVRLTLRGVRRHRAARPRRKRPIVLDTLRTLLAQRPAPGPASGAARRRDALLLLTGFAGALRRSELAALTFDDITPATDAATGRPLLVAALRATKTDPEARDGQAVALPRGHHPATCPVCAFAAWADVAHAHARGGREAVRALLRDDAPGPDTHICADTAAAHTAGEGPCARLADGTARPVFPAISRHGHLSATPMTGRAVADLVQRYARRAGLDPAAYGGHSLRAGFATQAALAGAADRQIMRQGRWASPKTVHTYIRTAAPLDDNAVTGLGL